MEKLDQIEINLLLNLLIARVNVIKSNEKYFEIPKYKREVSEEEELVLKLRKMLREI